MYHARRIQASIRSLAHLYHFEIRKVWFNKLIFDTSSSHFQPALLEIRQDVPNVTEIHSRLSLFISAWCSKEKSELFPFFHGLYGVLYIQSQNPWMMVDDGEHWVMWELDDAMFLESGYVIYQVLYIGLVIDMQLVVWFHVWCHSHPYKCFWILAFTWSITALKIKTSTDISLFKWLLWIACPSQPSTPFSHPFDLSDKKGVKFPDWTKLWLKQT